MTTNAPSLPNLLDPEHARHPEPNYEILRDHYPVVFDPVTQSWLVSRHEDVQAVLKDKRVSNQPFEELSMPVHGKTILVMDGKEHRAYRALLNPYLHGAELAKFGDRIRETVVETARPALDREAAAVSEGDHPYGEIDLVGDFAERFPIAVMAAMLELPGSDLEQFMLWYRSIVAFIGNLSKDDEVHQRGLRTRREFYDYIMPKIEERAGGEGTDLLSSLARAEVGGERLTNEAIANHTALSLSAGGETTAHLIPLLFRNLLVHRDVLERVRADRSLIPAAVAETLRYSTLVHWTQRRTVADVEIQGVTIPAGDLIILLFGAANTDPRKFDDPLTFDIDRPDNPVAMAFTGAAAHLGFGGGPHYCVGSRLALNEIEEATNYLFDHLPDLRLADADVPQQYGHYIRPLKELRIAFQPRPASPAVTGSDGFDNRGASG